MQARTIVSNLPVRLWALPASDWRITGTKWTKVSLGSRVGSAYGLAAREPEAVLQHRVARNRAVGKLQQTFRTHLILISGRPAETCPGRDLLNSMAKAQTPL